MAMTEEEAIKLLNQLKDFMENTNKMIATLMIRTNNLQVDISNIKKEIKNIKGDRRIIISN